MRSVAAATKARQPSGSAIGVDAGKATVPTAAPGYSAMCSGR
jgi:hypothetical protein